MKAQTTPSPIIFERKPIFGMKKSFVTLILAVSMLILASCGGNDDPADITTKTPDTSRPVTSRVENTTAAPPESSTAVPDPIA